MIVPHRYLLSLTVAYGLTNFSLAFYTTTLDLYVSIYIVEYYILTLLHSPLSQKTQKATNIIGYILFVVFAIITSLKIIEIVGANIT